MSNRSKEIIYRMNNPAKFLKGSWFSIQINFINPETGADDEVSFDVNCLGKEWREELIDLWSSFCEENNIDEDSITDAWATIIDEDFESFLPPLTVEEITGTVGEWLDRGRYDDVPEEAWVYLDKAYSLCADLL